MTVQSIDTSYDIDAPAEKVWALLEDFGNIQRWWPRGGLVDIERVEIEGDGIGMIRHIHNAGMPAPVSEQLDYLDRDSYTLKLSIVCDKPAGIIRYRATGSLKPQGEHRCRIEYHGEFEAEEGREKEARAFLMGAYQLMFTGMEETAGRE